MDNELDRILSSDRDIIPSSQFVRNVMVAVHSEASIPPPISFPWRHAMPGVAICVASLACLIVVAIIQFGKGSTGNGPEAAIFLDVVEVAKRIDLGWILLALVASFVPTKLAPARI